MIIDKDLISGLEKKAADSPRRRMNYNFHKSLDDECQRLLNVLMADAEIPVHRHDVDETFVVLKGSLDVLFYNDNGEIVSCTTLCLYGDNYGVSIPAGTWHTIKIRQDNTVIFEARKGPYKPRTKDTILEVK